MPHAGRFGHRGALSTLAADPAGYPYGSVASYGLDDRGNPLFFVSLMAEHTQNAIRDPRASLLVTEPVPDGADPLASGRATLIGTAWSRSTRPTATTARDRYLVANPSASYYIEFGDFVFYRLTVESIRYVGGYGRMSWVDAEAYAVAEADPLAGSATGIIEHMNADHADAQVLYCRHLAGHPDTTSASMSAVDRYGFEMIAITPNGRHAVRLGFPEPCTDANQVRVAMVSLIAKARAADVVGPGSAVTICRKHCVGCVSRALHMGKAPGPRNRSGAMRRSGTGGEGESAMRGFKLRARDRGRRTCGERRRNRGGLCRHRRAPVGGSAAPALTAQQQQAADAYAKLPVSFVENRGQTDSQCALLRARRRLRVLHDAERSHADVRQAATIATKSDATRKGVALASNSSAATRLVEPQGADRAPGVINDLHGERLEPMAHADPAVPRRRLPRPVAGHRPATSRAVGCPQVRVPRAARRIARPTSASPTTAPTTSA